MLSAPDEHRRRTHAHKFMPPFRIPIFLCAAQHRAFQRNNALYPTPNNAEPEPMHIHPQCPVPYLVILYSVQSPCFVLFLAPENGRDGSTNQKVHARCSGRLDQHLQSKVQHQETMLWTPPTHNSAWKALLFFVIKTKAETSEPPTHIIIAVTHRGGIIQQSHKVLVL